MGAKEVAAGAAWLDENFPGWEREIDLGTLNLEDCQQCICGQSLRELVGGIVDSGYHAAVTMGAGVSDGWACNDDFVRAVKWAAEHGFALDDESEGGTYDDFKKLEGIWVELLKERFSTGNLSDLREGDDD